jgi:hypothetical protein
MGVEREKKQKEKTKCSDHVFSLIYRELAKQGFFMVGEVSGEGKR